MRFVNTETLINILSERMLVLVMESKVKRYRRYAKYFFQWLFKEKIRGLDFSMRDKNLINASGGVFHGYSKTDESHAKDIFRALGVTADMKLLDVGCGKGAFLREAAKENFSALAGLEYVPRLAEIAKRNFKKMHLSNRIRIFTGDASKFQKYADYNVYYFFNPFDSIIMEQVFNRIIEEQKEDAYVILHNPVCSDVVVSFGAVEIKSLYDDVKSYRTIIYKLEKQVC